MNRGPLSNVCVCVGKGIVYTWKYEVVAKYEAIDSPAFNYNTYSTEYEVSTVRKAEGKHKYIYSRRELLEVITASSLKVITIHCHGLHTIEKINMLTETDSGNVNMVKKKNVTSLKKLTSFIISSTILGSMPLSLSSPSSSGGSRDDPSPPLPWP